MHRCDNCLNVGVGGGGGGGGGCSTHITKLSEVAGMPPNKIMDNLDLGYNLGHMMMCV